MAIFVLQYSHTVVSYAKLQMDPLIRMDITDKRYFATVQFKTDLVTHFTNMVLL